MDVFRVFDSLNYLEVGSGLDYCWCKTWSRVCAGSVLAPQALARALCCARGASILWRVCEVRHGLKNNQVVMWKCRKMDFVEAVEV